MVRYLHGLVAFQHCGLGSNILVVGRKFGSRVPEAAKRFNHMEFNSSVDRQLFYVRITVFVSIRSCCAGCYGWRLERLSV